eukprot:TRINITY_DN7460_c0_g1_i1.p1 TRINITY_DN7460_c0_g1~~TRINITY_DN7460_c0_g1_i1.p1  ORF type:complete len:211 (-),score=29.86 TRINITY_DN7460_c0_g1_i1:137-682(-)
MARVGIANYTHGMDAPYKNHMYWDQCVDREHRDHAYTTFNQNAPRASYSGLSTTSHDFMTRTWRMMGEHDPPAAGRMAFHHMPNKPPISEGFERHPAAQQRLPLPPSRSGSGRSVHSATNAAAYQVLRNAHSVPTIRAPDRPATGASGRSGRSSVGGARFYDDGASGRFSMTSSRRSGSRR